MEEVYSLEGLSYREVTTLRVALDSISLKGVDAIFIASLQINIQNQIKEIEDHIREENQPPLPPIPNPEELVVQKPKKKTTPKKKTSK